MPMLVHGQAMVYIACMGNPTPAQTHDDPVEVGSSRVRRGGQTALAFILAPWWCPPWFVGSFALTTGNDIGLAFIAWIALIALVGGYVVELLFGVPIYFLLRRIGVLTPAAMVGSGFLLGSGLGCLCYLSGSLLMAYFAVLPFGELIFALGSGALGGAMAATIWLIARPDKRMVAA